MPICVVVFEESKQAIELKKQMQVSFEAPIKIDLIRPSSKTNATNQQESVEEIKDIITSESIEIEKIKLLNPKLDRQIRQKTMAFWLMPFGFIAGIAFTKMTALTTFQDLGLSPFFEPLFGGLLGMGSGWIGSYVSSASVNPDTSDDIKALQKLNKEGQWLLLAETPIEIDLPWKILKKSNNLKIIRLNQI